MYIIIVVYYRWWSLSGCLLHCNIHMVNNLSAYGLLSSSVLQRDIIKNILIKRWTEPEYIWVMWLVVRYVQPGFIYISHINGSRFILLQVLLQNGCFLILASLLMTPKITLAVLPLSLVNSSDHSYSRLVLSSPLVACLANFLRVLSESLLVVRMYL